MGDRSDKAVRDEIDDNWVRNTLPNPKTPIDFMWADDVGPMLETADFVTGFLCKGAMSVVYGPANCGKSFLALDLAFHVATGRKWFDREVEQGVAVYLALEGVSGITNRIAAIRQRHGDNSKHAPFAVIPASIDLVDGLDTKRLIETIKIIGNAAKAPIQLVVVDTLSRAFGGKDENHSTDMGMFVKSVGGIINETGAHVMLIHHSGKDVDKGARGHSLLRAAADTEVEVTRSEQTGVVTARVTKQRDLPAEGEFGFTLMEVELGLDRRGRQVTSCVVEHVAPSGRRDDKSLHGDIRVAYTALLNVLAERGEPATGKSGVPEGAHGVLSKDWLSEFLALKPGEDLGEKEKTFARARDALLDKGHVAHRNGLFWLQDRAAWAKGA